MPLLMSTSSKNKTVTPRAEKQLQKQQIDEALARFRKENHETMLKQEQDLFSALKSNSDMMSKDSAERL